MAKLKDIIAYYCKHYPHKEELSKARLTKMVYLADWKSALERGKQISNIKWIYNHYGPYVDDVANEAQNSSIFHIENSTTVYGGDKEIVRLTARNYEPDLTRSEKEVLQHIISITATKYWNAFMELVYSTYPIMKSSQYAELDLVSLAHKYKSLT